MINSKVELSSHPETIGPSELEMQAAELCDKLKAELISKLQIIIQDEEWFEMLKNMSNHRVIGQLFGDEFCSILSAYTSSFSTHAQLWGMRQDKQHLT